MAEGCTASYYPCPGPRVCPQIQPQGEWSAKVEALLRRLLHLQTTAPNEKSLVFSQVGGQGGRGIQTAPPPGSLVGCQPGWSIACSGMLLYITINPLPAWPAPSRSSRTP